MFTKEFARASQKRSIESYRRRQSEKRKERLELEKAEAVRLLRSRSTPDWAVRIVIDTAAKYEVSPKDVLARYTKREPIIRAKCEIAYRMRQQSRQRSSNIIGRWLGRDHTTCLYLIARHSTFTGEPVLSNMKTVFDNFGKAS